MKTKKQFKRLEKKMEKNAHIMLIDLQKWLYVNHLDILREYEKSKGYNIQMHFLDEVKK